MKAILLHPGTTELRLADWNEPVIEKPDEVKVKVIRVGICGTDREEAAGGRADAPKGESELIIGHEMIGEVVAIGNAVKSVKPGDLVVITVRRGCGECLACQSFRFDLCTTGNYTERGIKGRHGFQAEYVVDQEKFLLKVPPAIASIAVLTEPMSVVEKAIDEAGIIQTARLTYIKDKQHWLQGKTALVAGLGPIGLLAALILRLRGANVLGIDIIDPNSLRAKIFNQFGGIYFNDRNIDMKKFQEEHPQIDLIVEAAGVAKLDFDLLQALGTNGIYVLTGIPGGDRAVSFDGAELMRKLVLKNQVMFGSVNATVGHFQKGLQDLEEGYKKWPDALNKLISQKFSFKQFDKALTGHSENEIKVVIEWEEGK